MADSLYCYLKNFTKRRNSTKKMSIYGLAQVNIRLKEPTNLVKPDLEFQTSTDPSTMNYIYIPNFGRYYFIDSWEWTPPYWTAHCTVDVLASFQAEIYGAEKYILRSTSHPSNYITDTEYPAGTNVSHNYAQARFYAYHNDLSDVWVPWAQTLAEGYYVVGIIGANQSSGSSAGSVTYYAMSPVELSKLVRYMLSGVTTSWTDISALTANISKVMVDPLQYIVSCMWFPLPPLFDSHVQATPIRFGWFDALDPDNGSTLSAYPLQSPVREDRWAMDVSAISGYSEFGSPLAWQYCEPVSSYILQANPWGVFPISSEFVAGYKYLGFTLRTDFVSGLSIMNVYGWGTYDSPINPETSPGVENPNFRRWDDPTYSSGPPVCVLAVSKSAQIGVQIQLSNQTSSLLSPLTNGIGGLTAGGLLGGAVGALVGGLGAMLGSVGGKFQSVGSNGGIASDEGTVTLHAFRRHLNMPTRESGGQTYLDFSERGTTCGKRLQINDLSGFIQCMDGEIGSSAWAEEKQMIADYLTGGFYKETDEVLP